FESLDRVLALLHDGVIRVSLATPTASPPPCFTFAYPDALPETASGVRLRHGSRDTYCASAPAYQEECRRIASVLAQRYADHPALALWHVHNEYGTWCHCGHVAASFRRWLRDRYGDRKSTRLNSSHVKISYAVFCLKKKKHGLHERVAQSGAQHRGRRLPEQRRPDHPAAAPTDGECARTALTGRTQRRGHRTLVHDP